MEEVYLRYDLRMFTTFNPMPSGLALITIIGPFTAQLMLASGDLLVLTKPAQAQEVSVAKGVSTDATSSGLTALPYSHASQ